jgi:hypothetical protein
MKPVPGYGVQTLKFAANGSTWYAAGVEARRVDPHREARGDLLVERVGLAGRRRVRGCLEKGDEVGVVVGHRERLGVDDTLELGCGANEGRDLEPELGFERALDRSLEIGAGAGRVERDVAAVDVSPYVAVAEAFEHRHQA